jgi:hypothetical protein
MKNINLDSGYSFFVLGEGGGGKREVQILHFFFRNIAFYFFTTIK